MHIRSSKEMSKNQKDQVRSFFNAIGSSYDEKYQKMHPFHYYFFSERLSEAKLINIRNGNKILDIGAGTGQLYNALIDINKSIEYFAVDLAEDMLAESQIPSSSRYVGSVADCPWQQVQFDFIFLLGVTTYLTKEDLSFHLDWIHDHCNSESTVVLTFTNSHSLDSILRGLFRFIARLFKRKNSVLGQAFPVLALSNKEIIDLLNYHGFLPVRRICLNHTIFPFNRLFPILSVKTSRWLHKHYSNGHFSFLSSDLLYFAIKSE